MTVETAAITAWRCGESGCRRKPVLAYYAETGGVHVRIAGAHGRVSNYIADLYLGPIDCQCPSCFSWRRLEYDRTRGEITEAARPGECPDL